MAARPGRKKAKGDEVGDVLGEYERKRDFEATPEPAPRKRRGRKAQSRFVVQEHSARRLHWDLRLEHDGVATRSSAPVRTRRTG